MTDPCPKCQDSRILGEIRGGGETERVSCDCALQDRSEPPEPPGNPTRPPAIEQRPDFAANPAIVETESPIKMAIQPIAPDYTCFLLTIKDPAGFESRWLIPGAGTIGPEEFDALLRAHEQIKTEEVKDASEN